MTHTLLALLPFLMFFVLLVMLELGYQYRLSHGDISNATSGPASTIVLSIMGLVLAFSFSNAAGRLDSSRATILAEVNAIGNTWLRIDVAEPQAQPRLKELVRIYLDTRIRV
jgi:hypothetical protein